MDTLVSALESTNAPPATAYGVHIGNLNAALADPAYRDILESATHLYADGTSTRLVSRFLGTHTPERLVTTDIIWPVLKAAASGGHPVYFLGGPDGLAAEAAAIVEGSVSGLELVGAATGYFPFEAGERVADAIARSGAHLVVVAMGVPREQAFCWRFADRTGARLLMTSGGLFGYIAGREIRAPLWMRRSGLEWAFRLVQSPSRLGKRYSRGAIVTVRLAFAARSVRRHRLRHNDSPATTP